MTTYSGKDFWLRHHAAWPLAPLGRVASLGTGHTPSRSHPEYWENCSIPWVTTEDLTSRTDGGLEPLMDTRQKISQLGLDNSAAVVHPTDTVMLSRTASIGHSVRIGGPMATTQAFVTWTCGPRLDPRYLLVVLNAMKPEFDRIAYGSTHLTIYFPDVEALRVPVPPLAVQRAIADYLYAETARIDALIAKKRRLIELLDERLAGVVEQAIRDLAADVGEIPLKWVVSDITVGIVIMPSQWYTDDDQGVRAVRGFNVRPGRVTAADAVHITHEGHRLHSKSRLRSGDVLVVRTGQAGAAAVVPGDLEGANCIDLLLIRRSPRLVSKFLEYVLNSDWTRKHVEAHSVGTIQSHFNVGALGDLPVPVPNIESQHRAVDLLDAEVTSTNALRERLVRQIDVLVEHRQALITAAVTGELSVPGVAA